MGGCSVQRFEQQFDGIYSVNLLAQLMPGDIRRVWRQGHSLTITLPVRFCESHGIEAGDYIAFSYEIGYGKVTPLSDS